MHDIEGNWFKKIEYQYDLISGKVNEVAYQRGWKDQFYHRYEYDAENKLTEVYTSPDYVYWERQAKYSYYKHGPLARTEIGQLGVQGVDYAYTLQGWLKGVNSTDTTGSEFDMGGDGPVAHRTARDAYGFSLNYNTVDYKAINDAVYPFATVADGLPALGDGVVTGKSLFNGNIASMLVSIPKVGAPVLYGYRYDLLNRIRAMNAYQGMAAGTNVFTPTVSQQYKERVSYDANGNILSYIRHGNSPVTMDSLTYGYNLDGGGRLVNNRLRHVKDGVSSSNYAVDIDNQDDDNYTYDAIGNLVHDEAEGIDVIAWNVYGKISYIEKATGVTTSYTYDAAGNRIGKTVDQAGELPTLQTWYVRDASGNVMAIYENENSEVNSGHLSQTEVHLYGSSRVGVWRPDRDVEETDWWLFDTEPMSGTNGLQTETWTRNRTSYELSNHLGNVLVTVSDRKLGIDIDDDDDIDYYEADIATANDYYPFGMQMPGRGFSTAGSYRYGFNGKEQDKDLHSLMAYDYGFRIYNSSIGRFLSVDPLTKSYPQLTPYSFAENDVIRSIDLDGLEKYVVTYWYDNKGNHRRTTIRAITAQDSKEEMDLNFSTANGIDLTEENVWVRKLYLDGRQKEKSTGKATLSASEQALYNTARHSRTKEFIVEYDLGDEKGGEEFRSEKFDNTKYEYARASKEIPLLKEKDLTLKLYNSSLGLGDNYGNFTLNTKKEAEWMFKIFPDVKKFYDLPSSVKDDGGIKSIDITIQVTFITGTPQQIVNGMKRSSENMADQIKAMYQNGSGVKNVNSRVVYSYVSSQEEATNKNKTTPNVEIKLNR